MAWNSHACRVHHQCALIHRSTFHMICLNMMTDEFSTTNLAPIISLPLLVADDGIRHITDIIAIMECIQVEDYAG